MYKKIIMFFLIICTPLSHGMEKTVLEPNISEKSEQLFKIATNPYGEFTKENLSDLYLINASSHYWNPLSDDVTLLSEAYRTLTHNPQVQEKPLQKIEDLINSEADVKQPINNDLLRKIAIDRVKPSLICCKIPLLRIAYLLLAHGAHPDFHSQPNDPTPLLITVCRDDQDYARLLLWHNANPYKKGTWIDSSLKNSFEVEKSALDFESTGWLKAMINEKQNIIHNYWLFKEYFSTNDILPSELPPLIISIYKTLIKKLLKIAH
jgi:hypothetical protein